MKNVTYANHWQPYFEHLGLRSFDDFFNYEDGETVNQNTKRNVVVLKLPHNIHTKTFFMKRFFNPHFKDMLFTLRNFGKLCSQGELEWRNANILLEHGIETYHPACFGVETLCGIERRSFFITEEINGICLQDYLVQYWADLADDDKEKIVLKLAAFFKKIHAVRISLPDAYIWHVYMVKHIDNAEDFEFGMIDLHRMQINTRGNRQAAENLGRFLFSLPEGFLDEKLRNAFIENYLDADFIRNRDAFVATMTKREKTLLKRRKKRPIQIG
ncbi:MAG: hypothetical protein H8E62_01760 [Planctomycetes bacterium]|nr:hypothetical protein [Planctomycetota bacterium]